MKPYHAYPFKQGPRLHHGSSSRGRAGYRREVERRTTGRSPRRQESSSSSAGEVGRGKGRRRQGGGAITGKAQGYCEESSPRPLAKSLGCECLIVCEVIPEIEDHHQLFRAFVVKLIVAVNVNLQLTTISDNLLAA
jgi:hypothetical protein